MRNIHNHKEDSVSPNFAQFRNIRAPHWAPKMLHSSLEL